MPEPSLALVAAVDASAPLSAVPRRVTRADHRGHLPSHVRCPIPCAGLVAAVDLALVFAALAAVVAAANTGHMPRGLQGFLSIRVTLEHLLLLAFLGAGSWAALHAVGLYDALQLRGWAEETRRAGMGATLIAVIVAIFAATSRGTFTNASLVAFWVLVSAGLVAARSVRGAVTGREGERRRVLIVGSGPHALRVHRELCADALQSYTVLGFVDTAAATASRFLARRTLGSLDDLERILAREHVDEVHVGLPVKSHYREIHDTLRVCELLGVKATYHADFFDTAIARPRMPSIGRRPRVEMQVAPEGWRLALKRAIDVAGAAGALAVLSPLMLMAALAVKLTSRGPVIFAQERYGLNRRRFRMFKFRTMVVDADRLQDSLEARNEADGPVFKMARDPRVTRVGRVLRRTSIDELPQLLNVLRGDMSLVGPRPLPLRDVARFTRPGDLRRFSVRPGLTCLWQVSGRSGIGFDEWVRLDLQYIDHWSLGLDFEVLAMTVPAVVRGTGAA